ncbi:aldo/keto reductase [Rummeliibacillus pycnus]|uniref:aldo/keto reductase n=1 Tax=Rummeliibacillus pycnus TaxID=101070 RepID=UPI000C9AFAA6|nr:aldo/keto reductase [Rummeliibacillus pycnus]
MKKRQLGSSNLHISEIGLGCMSLPTNLQDASYIMDSALDYGINYFDTADLYNRGLNEEIIGQFMKEKRQDIILATKVGNIWDSSGDSWHWDASKTHIKEGIKDSLHRLKTDYIDLYQLHGGTMEDNWDNIIEAFEELKQEGMIREYGISSIRPNVLKRFLPTSNAVSVMMQYSMLDRRPEEWLDFIADQGASVVTRGSLAKGLLTNEWQKRLINTNGYLTYSQEELENILTKITNSTTSIHAVALKTILQHPTIASAVVGASSKEQLVTTMKAYKEMDAIINIKELIGFTKEDTYTSHRD